MSQPSPREESASGIIRKRLMALSEELRARHRFLAHQDAIGVCLFLASSALIVASWTGFLTGALAAVWMIPLAAFGMSILHELEHDLIHRLYFKDSPRVYDLLMAGVWFFRPTTINPWTRRAWHLHHHRASGSESDIEEQVITNGEPWGLRRLLMTIDPSFAVSLRVRDIYRISRAYVNAQQPGSPEERRRLIRKNRRAWIVPGLVMQVWHLFLGYHVLMAVLGALGYAPTLGPGLARGVSVMDAFSLMWVAPNLLRVGCLHFISSNMHYFGDVAPRNVVQQTQVLNAAWLLPFQLFCFNFGSTHAIHHFAVQDPFYLRQWIAKDAHAVMRAHGVRFNDFGTFRRANRWSELSAPAAESARTRTAMSPSNA